MLAIGFPAAAFGTNCFVLAPAEGEECVVVDPGIGVVDTLTEVLREHRLKPAAVLLTHGHLDHTYSVTPVCGAHGVAARIHPDDRYRLVDPVSDAGMVVQALESQMGVTASWTEPEDVVDLDGGATLQIAGLTVEVLHAPGHTEGSVVFRVPDVPQGVEGLTSTLVSGDVLFAGSIGRTDLPGGDHAAMQRSLRDVVLPLADDTLVLPGHGPATSIARERQTNPYLLELVSNA